RHGPPTSPAASATSAQFRCTLLDALRCFVGHRSCSRCDMCNSKLISFSLRLLGDPAEPAIEWINWLGHNGPIRRTNEDILSIQLELAVERCQCKPSVNVRANRITKRGIWSKWRSNVRYASGV